MSLQYILIHVVLEVWLIKWFSPNKLKIVDGASNCSTTIKRKCKIICDPNTRPYLNNICSIGCTKTETPTRSTMKNPDGQPHYFPFVFSSICWNCFTYLTNLPNPFSTGNVTPLTQIFSFSSWLLSLSPCSTPVLSPSTCFLCNVSFFIIYEESAATIISLVSAWKLRNLQHSYSYTIEQKA